MDKHQLVIAAAGVGGLGVLTWLLTRPSNISTAPTTTTPDGQTITFQEPNYTTPPVGIPDQAGNTVAFPQPNYTLPNFSNPASLYSPVASRSVASSGIPAPVPSQNGTPVYLQYNFPLVEPTRPNNTVDPAAPSGGSGNSGGSGGSGGCSGCSGGSGGGCAQACTTCSDGGTGSLATSPADFVANLIGTFPNFARSVIKNINSTGIATTARPQASNQNPLNGARQGVGVTDALAY